MIFVFRFGRSIELPKHFNVLRTYLTILIGKEKFLTVIVSRNLTPRIADTEFDFSHN